MGDKCYSTNNEDFNFNEIENAVEMFIDSMDGLLTGREIVVYEGDAVKYQAGDFFVSVPVDEMAENAYELAGEYAGTWPSSNPMQHIDLLERIKSIINQWADDYGLQPKFYKVENVKEIKVMLLDEDGDYEILV